MASDERVEEVERLFYMPNLIGWWYPIQNKYRQFGFKDDMSDTETIEEYDYIAHNLNKYISSHKLQIVGDGDLEDMRDNLEALHAKADDGGRERKKLVYASLRDDWLISTMSAIDLLIEEEANARAEMELGDEW